MAIDQVAYLGGKVTDSVAGLGQFARFVGETARFTFRRGGGFGKWRLLVPQMFMIGTMSIPVVAIVGAFIGMVLALEAYDQFALMGLEERLGGIINVSVVRQVGPVLAAVMIAGRVGGAVSAELGTMRVTEQIDALRAMGADPIGYLVVPRVLACVIMVPVLTVFSDFMGIKGGEYVTVQGFGVDWQAYRWYAAEFVEAADFISGLIKSVFFGLTIGVISCYKGFNCRPGAAGVGRAATDAFVTSFIVIIVSNLFLAYIIKVGYTLIWGDVTVTLAG
jgi:phospholipid/cholesterol/gamma-HCH transport system permease protein